MCVPFSPLYVTTICCQTSKSQVLSPLAVLPKVAIKLPVVLSWRVTVILVKSPSPAIPLDKTTLYSLFASATPGRVVFATKVPISSSTPEGLLNQADIENGESFDPSPKEKSSWSAAVRTSSSKRLVPVELSVIMPLEYRRLCRKQVDRPFQELKDDGCLMKSLELYY